MTTIRHCSIYFLEGHTIKQAFGTSPDLCTPMAAEIFTSQGYDWKIFSSMQGIRKTCRYKYQCRTPILSSVQFCRSSGDHGGWSG